MATMAATVTSIRRILADVPERVHLNGAIANATVETVVLDTTDIGKIAIGQVLEHDDGGASGAEQRLVISVNADAASFEAYRGFNGSTAESTHADNSFMLVKPRYAYDAVAQATNTVLETNLFNEGLYDLNEHTVVSNADGSRDYNAPTSSCEQFLTVYQFTATMTEPLFLKAGEFSRYPRNTDTTHYATGKMFVIRKNFGVPGTENFYVTCGHRLVIGTLNIRHERIVQWLACAYLLEWEEPRRHGQDTTQGDRSVRPGQRINTSAYYRQLANEAITSERAEVKKLVPPQRVWRSRDGRRF